MKKALFLDRDGVINKVIKKYNRFYGKFIDDSPFNISELKFNDGIKELAEFAKKKDYLIIIVTNQPSLAYGNMSILDYEALTTKICNYLELKRSQIFECFHKEGITLECECRKPKSGLFLMAKGVFDIDVANSVMIGDTYTDVLAAREAGVKKTFFLKREKSRIEEGNRDSEEKMNELNIHPSFTIKNLKEIIEKELI